MKSKQLVVSATPIVNNEYTIAAISKSEIIDYFKVKYKRADSLNKKLAVLNRMSHKDMIRLASKLESEYVSSIFWDDLEIAFNELFFD